jgi:hypothetical protein
VPDAPGVAGGLFSGEEAAQRRRELAASSVLSARYRGG